MNENYKMILFFSVLALIFLAGTIFEHDLKGFLGGLIGLMCGFGITVGLSNLKDTNQD